jgi:hypothetical protein
MRLEVSSQKRGTLVLKQLDKKKKNNKNLNPELTKFKGVASMQKEEIESLLKQELKIQKDIIALKPLKEIPKNIPSYDGCATPGLCTQIGEILNDSNGLLY